MRKERKDRSASPSPRPEKRKERKERKERSASPPAAKSSKDKSKKTVVKSKPVAKKRAASGDDGDGSSSDSSSSSSSSSDSSSESSAQFAKDDEEDGEEEDIRKSSSADKKEKKASKDKKEKKAETKKPESKKAVPKRSRSKERAEPSKKSKRSDSAEKKPKAAKSSSKTERERSRPRDNSEERASKPKEAAKKAPETKRAPKKAAAPVSDAAVALKANVAARSKALALLPMLVGPASSEIKDPVFDELYLFICKSKGVLMPTYVGAKDGIKPSSSADEKLRHVRIYEDLGKHILTSSPVGDIVALFLGQPVAPRAVSVVRAFPAANPLKAWDGMSYKPDDGKRRKIGYKTLVYLSNNADWTINVPLPAEYYPVPVPEAATGDGPVYKTAARTLSLDAPANSVHVVSALTTVTSTTAGAFAVFVVVPGVISDMPVSNDVQPIPIQMDSVRDFAPEDKDDKKKAKKASGDDKKEKKEKKPKSAAESGDEVKSKSVAGATDAPDVDADAKADMDVDASNAAGEAAETKNEAKRAPEPAKEDSKPEPVVVPEPEPVKAPTGTDTIENLAQVASDYFAEVSCTVGKPLTTFYTIPVSHEHASHAEFIKCVEKTMSWSTEKPKGVTHRPKTLTLKDGTVVHASAVSRTDSTIAPPSNCICVILTSKLSNDRVRHALFTNIKLNDEPGNIFALILSNDKGAKMWRGKGDANLTDEDKKDLAKCARVRAGFIAASLQAFVE